MNSLPKEIEDIIFDFKNQLQYSKCLEEIKKIKYTLKYVILSTEYEDEYDLVDNFDTIELIEDENYIVSSISSRDDVRYHDRTYDDWAGDVNGDYDILNLFIFKKDIEFSLNNRIRLPWINDEIEEDDD